MFANGLKINQMKCIASIYQGAESNPGYRMTNAPDSTALTLRWDPPVIFAHKFYCVLKKSAVRTLRYVLHVYPAIGGDVNNFWCQQIYRFTNKIRFIISRYTLHNFLRVIFNSIYEIGWQNNNNARCGVAPYTQTDSCQQTSPKFLSIANVMSFERLKFRE